MKTDVIIVSGNGSQMDVALKQAEKVAVYKELSHKDSLHLRLLAEEMLSMVSSITGNQQGKFWIEEKDNVYQLHFEMITAMDASQRNALISASTSGINEANRGFMGKIRSFFEPTDDIPVIVGLSHNDVTGDLTWSLSAYQAELEVYLKQEKTGAAEAWDELEKSVVTHIADDVKVSIKGREVELVITKKFA